MKNLSLKNTCWYFLIIFQVATYGLYAIYIHLCEKDGHLPFNSTSLNFSIEFIKLVICFFCYLISSIYSQRQTESFKEFFKEFSFKKSLYFSIPGVLYCINNNLGKNK